LETLLESSLVPEELHSVGFGLLGAVNGCGQLISSMSVGLLWTAFSPMLAFSAAGLLMTIGTVALARCLPQAPARVPS